jgi:protein-L-isoaspartate O-methyltransferase
MDAESLVNALHLAGNLPAECRSAFLAVQRELFVPDRMWVQEVDGGRYEPVDRAVEPERWLGNVYSDRVVVTQFDDGHTEWPDAGRRPTCSASMPSAVAGMLAELNALSGNRVYEIGTGTGYNAALLGHQVRSTGTVTTVEVDPDLADTARMNLEAAGVANVGVECADGTVDVASPAPLDRIIATASVRLGQLPYAWVRSARPDAVIVAPMRVDLASGPLVRFIVNEDGTATGHASSSLRVGFMELRSHRLAASWAALQWDDPAADVSFTDLAPWVPLLDENHRWPIAVALPSCRYEVWEKTEERPGVAWLCDALSGSWASIVRDGDRHIVRQSGPRRLWDAAEAAYRWWQRRGEPPLEAWLWTITPDRQSITI